MKRACLIAGLAAALGCGGEAAAVLGPALDYSLRQLGKLVKDRTGNMLSQYPSTCDHEYNPVTQKLYMLCEVDLSRTVTP
jgi:hypothetical protein